MRRKTLGLVTNLPQEVFQHKVIIGFDEIAAQRGYHSEVITFTPGDDFAAIEDAASRSTGLLVIANVLSDDQLARLNARGLPVSLVSHYVPRLPVPAIISNNRQGVAISMQHIVRDCGCKRPVMICGDMSQNDAIQRATAFDQELMRYDLEILPQHRLRGDFIPAIAAESLRAFLQTRPHFDALLAADYLMAIAALEVLAEFGVRVPDDVVVLGFGDAVEAETAGLTTVAADIIELGRRGTRQLLGQIDGLTIRGLTQLSTELVIRNTTCPPQTK